MLLVLVLAVEKSLTYLEMVAAYYAPAASLVEMAEAILKDQRRILPTIAYLEGEYGYDGIYLVYQQYLVQMVLKKSSNLN